MEIGAASLLIFGGLGALIALGVPYAHAAGAIAVVTVIASFGPPALFLLASRTYDLATSFALIAVPLFVLMAGILEQTGIARDLYVVVARSTARLRGGIGIATVVIAVVLGATTGIIGGEIVLLGLVALPQMLLHGYDRRLAIGLCCAGGALGTMVPPSIVLVFYGVTTGTAIGDLFLASALPALLLALMYAGYTWFIALFFPQRAPLPKRSEAQPHQILRTARDFGLPAGVAASVLGTIYAGVASVSEAAGCGVAGTLIAALVRRELQRDVLKAALTRTVVACGAVMWLVFATSALIGAYHAIGGLAFAQATLSGLVRDQGSFIAVAVVSFLALGFVLDWIAILFLTMPLFGPLMQRFMIDPVWLGVVFNLTVQVAYLTPPMGPACFYLKSVAPPEISLDEIFAAMWPFVGLQVAVLIMLLTVPDLALWLPRVLR